MKLLFLTREQAIAELTTRNGRLSEDEWLISINLASDDARLIKDKSQVLNIEGDDLTLSPSQLFKIFHFCKMEIGSKIWVGQKMFLTCSNSKLAIAAGYFVSEIYGEKKFEQPILFDGDISAVPGQLKTALDQALHTYFWLESYATTMDSRVPF